MMDNKLNAVVPNMPDGSVAQPANIQVLGRPDIQTLFIDKFLFVKRPDGTLLTCGIQGVPGVEIEQLRFIMTEDHAKRFLDSLSRLLNYFPVIEPKEVPVKQNTKNSSSKKKTAAKQTKTVDKKKQKSK